MADVGIVRQVDELGRIVLPSELRERLGIRPGDGLEVFLEGDCLVLRPYRPGCVFCGEVDSDAQRFRRYHQGVWKYAEGDVSFLLA